MTNFGHTDSDALTIIAGGGMLDRQQPRERSVPCRVCNTPTWNIMARCDNHYEPVLVRPIDLTESHDE